MRWRKISYSKSELNQFWSIFKFQNSGIYINNKVFFFYILPYLWSANCGTCLTKIATVFRNLSVWSWDGFVNVLNNLKRHQVKLYCSLCTNILISHRRRILDSHPTFWSLPKMELNLWKRINHYTIFIK